ncbi:MAG TPA: glycosyltransferase [Actinocatenispora sp.]
MRGNGHVVVVSASVGAGHDGAARELVRRLAAAGYDTDTYDFCQLLPARSGGLLRDGYRWQLRRAPRSYQWLLGALEYRWLSAGTAALTAAADRRLLATVRADTVAVLSTYPLASLALGRLRRRGLLGVPAVTYLTDLSVHPQWIGCGVDAHLALHATTAEAARELGATGVRVVRPALSPVFRPATGPAEVAAARRRFGLPDGPLALVVTGSLGLGEPAETAADVAATGLATPVVACGRHATLRRRLAGRSDVVPLGWVDDMPTLLRACDLVIQNAGGLSSLEALASGVPAITYRCIPGHGRANARALHRSGLIPWVTEPDGLAPALAYHLGRPAAADPFGTAPEPVALLTELATRTPAAA